MSLTIIKIQKQYFEKSKNSVYLILCQDENNNKYIIYVCYHLDEFYVKYKYDEFFNRYSFEGFKKQFNDPEGEKSFYIPKNNTIFDLWKLFKQQTLPSENSYFQRGTLILNEIKFEKVESESIFIV